MVGLLHSRNIMHILFFMTSSFVHFKYLLERKIPRFKFDDERVTKEDAKRALEEQYGGEEEVCFTF